MTHPTLVPPLLADETRVRVGAGWHPAAPVPPAKPAPAAPAAVLDAGKVRIGAGWRPTAR